MKLTTSIYQEVGICSKKTCWATGPPLASASHLQPWDPLDLTSRCWWWMSPFQAPNWSTPTDEKPELLMSDFNSIPRKQVVFFVTMSKHLQPKTKRSHAAGLLPFLRSFARFDLAFFVLDLTHSGWPTMCCGAWKNKTDADGLSHIVYCSSNLG